VKQILYAEEIALAMELQSTGCPLKLVARGLGVSHKTLYKAMWLARKRGFVSYPKRLA
jgi:hypothetical protein